MAQRLVCAAGMIALVLLGLDQLRPPSCPSNPGRADFSCERAIVHLRAVASVTHPSNSPADRAVRDYLLGQMREMGLEPRVLSARAVGYGRLLSFDNLLGRLPGTTHGPSTSLRTGPSTSLRTGPALVLCCHYDSVPFGPGAGDDGAAVAALMETMRALKAGPPLRNDVYLLITDGEELGMLGASWLVTRPDLLPDVGVMLNFDARGTCGPSILFETSAGNSELVREFARVAPDPFGTSLGYDVYKKMPNDTDFTFFRRAGMRGLNFAFIGNYIYYHTPQDTIEHLDHRTLYHTGAYALALARHFGNEDLEPLKNASQSDAVFFNPVRGVMVVYGYRWNWPLVAVLVIATLAMLAWGLRRRRVRILGLLWALGCVILTLAAAAGADYGIWALAQVAMRHGWMPSFQGFRLRPSPTAGGITALVILYSVAPIGIAALIIWIFSRFTRWAEFAMAAAMLWAGAAIATAVLLPGGTYLACWPALFAVGGLLICWRAPRNGWLQVIAVLFCSAPLLLMLPTSVVLFFTALTVVDAFKVAPLVVMGLWLLITSGCIPLLCSHKNRTEVASSPI
jgi:hypothetical protein